ncbi:hypothetical protein RRG08_034561 [Elysia crispata]|uniref:Uncharacterized protein n=1 Tax=Elysia crispata TaxID=231223 RepID=A0AAE1E924_9GAST|nr:hypothetical protein RRG08_034561 [Elysia crispata]
MAVAPTAWYAAPSSINSNDNDVNMKCLPRHSDGDTTKDNNSVFSPRASRLAGCAVMSRGSCDRSQGAQETLEFVGPANALRRGPVWLKQHSRYEDKTGLDLEKHPTLTSLPDSLRPSARLKEASGDQHGFLALLSNKAQRISVKSKYKVQSPLTGGISLKHR